MSTKCLIFTATWCGPCKFLKQQFDAEKDNVAKHCTVEIVDVDTEAATAAKYRVRAVPTVILEKDGEVSDVFQGAAAFQQVKAALKI